LEKWSRVVPGKAEDAKLITGAVVATWNLVFFDVAIFMGGLSGGLFGLFNAVGRAFFTVLIGAKRASRTELRSNRVVVGSIICCAIAGSSLFLFLQPTPASLALGVGAGVGGLVGLVLASILLAYVWSLEAEEEREKWRAEQIAKGLDPDRACFIATAVFGSAESAETTELRNWRDRWLMPSRFGRRIVIVYYRVSPGIATFLEQKGFLKYAVRGILKAFICVVRKRTIKECSAKRTD